MSFKKGDRLLHFICTHFLSFFIKKLAAIKASNPTLKLLPVLLVDGIDTKALNKLKSNGVLIASIKELFGKDYSDLIKNLINTVTND